MSTPQFAYGAYIGRFEPPHSAHLAVMREALEFVGVLIVVLGSARAARNVKNPWTADEREVIIAGMLAEAGVPASRVRFARVRDFFYDEARWLAEVREGVAEHAGSAGVALIGHVKDDSSYYLRSFPDWPYLPTRVESPLNATDIRRLYFGGHGFEGREFMAEEYLPPAVARFLEAFRDTPDFADLQAEYEFARLERARLAQTPGEAVRITTNAAVRENGHVLLIRRDTFPGKGLLALPGATLDARRTLLASCLDTLRAQTGLGETPDFEATSRAGAVFDYPDRSSAGRAVAHAFAFDLGPDNLGIGPPPSSAKTGAKALWLPLPDALESPELFFEDHHAMLEHFFAR